MKNFLFWTKYFCLIRLIMFCEWHRKFHIHLHSVEGFLLFSPVRPGMCSSKRDPELQRGSQGVTAAGLLWDHTLGKMKFPSYIYSRNV